MTATSIGVITWTRLDGDASGLPTSVSGGEFGSLEGDEGDQLGVWSSVNGLLWERSTYVVVEQEAGGVSWVSSSSGGDHRLSQLTETGESPVDLNSLAVDVPEGFVVSSELVEPGSGRVVWELGGDVFVFVVQRTRLPWAEILGRSDGRYRVSVSASGESMVETAGDDADDLTVERFLVRPSADAGLYDVVDEEDNVTWAYDADGGPPVRAIHGTAMPQWMTWDGHEFVIVDTPWASDQTVDLAELDEGVLVAVTDAATATVQLWHSSNGRMWNQTALPAEPLAGTPLPRLAGDGEPLVRIYTATGQGFWSTTDGETFERLPDVPGIAQRSKGSPGWVAPDPRSFPRIRVSPDGTDWEEIELGEMLGVEGSFWDLTISARIIDSTIYVTATRPDARILLIGAVEPQP